MSGGSLDYVCFKVADAANAGSLAADRRQMFGLDAVGNEESLGEEAARDVDARDGPRHR